MSYLILELGKTSCARLAFLDLSTTGAFLNSSWPSDRRINTTSSMYFSAICRPKPSASLTNWGHPPQHFLSFPDTPVVQALPVGWPVRNGPRVMIHLQWPL